MTLSFTLIHLAPGDPVSALVGEYGGASPEFIAQLRARYGLDRPIIVQYGLYLWNVSHGNLGRSIRFDEPVWQLFQEHAPATLLLLGTSIVVFTMIGVLAGVYSATRNGDPGEVAVNALVVLGFTLPVFWLGQLLIYGFAVRLRLFPVMGMHSFSAAPSMVSQFLDVVWHLVLPMTALGVWNMAVTQRFLRTSLIQVLHQEYIRTAFAKGLGRSQVLYRHALRNALLPVVTITGLSFGTMLTGAALTEIVFSWPGLGQLILQAVLSRDRPLLLGLLLITAAMTIVADAATDLAYGLLDPRIGGNA